MQKEFGITTIYVTHDQEEALTLSDCISVFNKGVIEQTGTPNDIYNHSSTEFVANFIGDINCLDSTITSQLGLSENHNHFIRLERIRVEREDSDGLEGVISSQEYYGLYIKYYIRAGLQTLKVIEKNDGVNIYKPGDNVRVIIRLEDIMSYPKG